MELREIFNKDVLAVIPTEFLDLDVIAHGDWSEWEENGWYVIFKFFDEFFVWEYSYCVFSEDNSAVFDPIKIEEDDIKTFVEHWSESYKG